jgi:histidinol-phosphate aminotransferase
VSETPPKPLPHVEALQAYVPGEQPQEPGWTKLNTNENPYPPSPRVREAILAEMGGGADRLRLYPEPLALRLREAIAGLHAVAPAAVLAGNGSDDVLNLLVRAYCGPGRPAGMTVPSYSLYPVLCGIQGCDLVEVPFDRHFSLDVPGITGSGAGVFFLTSPNAPSGVAFTNEAIAAVAGAFPGLLVVDEAYAAYAEQSATALLGDFPNLAVTRSLSKSHSLAGLRVGYILAHPEVIAALDKVRDSYNLDRLAQAGALAAIEDAAWTDTQVARVKSTRERVRARLEGLGWDTCPSQANFLFTEPREATGEAGAPVAASLFEHLKARRVLVRRFPNNPLTAPFLRVSIGTDPQMDTFLEMVESWLKNKAAKPRV